MDDMTLFEDSLEERLRAYARNGVQPVDSTAVARAVAAGDPRSAATRPAVRRLGGDIQRPRRRAVIALWRTRLMSGTTFAAAAVVAAVALGGAYFVIQRGQPSMAGPNPTLNATPSPGQPTSTATPQASLPPVSQSLDLTWTEVDIETNVAQVAWLGDRFVLVDAAGAVSTSSDGANWDVLQAGDPDPGYADLLKGRIVSWEEDIVGWWNPEDGPDYTNKPPVTARDILRVVLPPAEPTESTPFEGRIESIGVGPQGIVAHVHSHLNYATEVNWDSWVASKLGQDWVSHMTDVHFEGGVLDIDMDNGPGLHVVWADEGFEPGDYQDRGFGWYSPDGVDWTAIPSDIPPALDRGDLPAFPTGLGEVVGVSDGFIASGVVPEETCSLPNGCSGMWHSADGLVWRNLGHPDAGPESWNGRLVPWKGGALVTDGVGHFDLWTSQGYSELPMGADFPAPAEFRDPTYTPFATGPLGLVSIRRDSMEILVTRDGFDWKIQPMPAAMVTEGDLEPTIAVGDRSVLYLTWSGHFGKGEAYVPSLWVGSVEP